jgi:hypothetical protein
VFHLWLNVPRENPWHHPRALCYFFSPSITFLVIAVIRLFLGSEPEKAQPGSSIARGQFEQPDFA